MDGCFARKHFKIKYLQSSVGRMPIYNEDITLQIYVKYFLNKIINIYFSNYYQPLSSVSIFTLSVGQFISI